MSPSDRTTDDPAAAAPRPTAPTTAGLGPADVVTAMLGAIDELDWDTLRGCFAATVATDYTSLWGGEPETLPIDDLIGRWQDLAHGYDATQHLTGPILTRPAGQDRATCTTTVRGYHHLVEGESRGTWMVAGRYTMDLARQASPGDAGGSRGSGGPGGSDGWAIAGITLSVAYEDGDRGLVDVALQRSAEGRGGRTALRPT
jgi:hypothetical protein